MLPSARYSQVLSVLLSFQYWFQLVLLLVYWNARTVFSRLIMFLIAYGSTLSLYCVVVSFVLLVKIPIDFFARSRLSQVVTVKMQHPLLCALFCGELVLLTGGAVSEWVGSMSGRTTMAVILNTISTSVEYFGVAAPLERVGLLLASVACCVGSLLMWAYYATLLPDASLGKAHMYLQYTFLVQAVAHTLEAGYLLLTTTLKLGLYNLLAYCVPKVAPRVNLENTFIDPSGNFYRLVFGAAHSLLTFFFALYYCPSDMPLIYQLAVFRRLFSTVVSYYEFHNYFKLLEAFPSVPGDPNESCTICLDAFKAHEQVRQMPCQHRFHDSCLRAWLLHASTCPICRHSVHSFLPTGTTPRTRSPQGRAQRRFAGFVQPMPRPQAQPAAATTATPSLQGATTTPVLLQLRSDPRLTQATEKLERAAAVRQARERAYLESTPGSPLPWRTGAALEELVGAQEAQPVRDDQPPKRSRGADADSKDGEEKEVETEAHTTSANRPPKRKKTN